MSRLNYSQKLTGLSLGFSMTITSLFYLILMQSDLVVKTPELLSFLVIGSPFVAMTLTCGILFWMVAGSDE